MAQANIFRPSGRRCRRTWVADEVGSSPAKSLRRPRGSIRSRALQGPVLPNPSPRAPRARRHPGPRAQRDDSGMNEWVPADRAAPPRPRPGSRAALRRLTFPGGGGGGGSCGGRGRRSGAGCAGAGRLLSSARHPDGEGGESGATRKTPTQGHFGATLLVAPGEGQRQPRRAGAGRSAKAEQPWKITLELCIWAGGKIGVRLFLFIAAESSGAVHGPLLSFSLRRHLNFGKVSHSLFEIRFIVLPEASQE